MRAQTAIHQCKKLRVDRYYKDIGCIVLQIVTADGSELEYSLYGLPEAQAIKLIIDFGDNDTVANPPLQERRAEDHAA